MNSENKISIIFNEPNLNIPVFVSLNKQIGLWEVEQEKRIIMHCSHLILRNAVFNHGQNNISGFISSVEEIDEIRRRLGYKKNLNSSFKYDTIIYRDKEFRIDGRTKISFCPYLDMVSWDNPLTMMLAIYPGDIVWGK